MVFGKIEYGVQEICIITGEVLYEGWFLYEAHRDKTVERLKSPNTMLFCNERPYKFNRIEY